MSILLPLKPIGIGTDEVESFQSYFGRLAAAHECSVGQLARFVESIGAPADVESIKRLDSLIYRHHGAGIAGPSSSAERFVRMVQKAVGTDLLMRCTFQALLPAMNPRAWDPVHSSRRWCEQCLREDDAEERPRYERLIWTSRWVERCHVHRLLLRFKCPKCTLEQRYLHRSGRIGTCWKCDASLIGPTRSFRPMLQPSYGEKEVLELVSAISKGDLKNAKPDAFGEFEQALAALVSPMLAPVSEIAAKSGSAKSTGKAVKPNFRTMIRKAAAAGVSILSVLQDPRSAAQAAGQLAQVPQLAP